MSLEINLELSDDDLVHFKDALRQAQETARTRDPATIVADAHKILEQTRDQHLPSFIRERLDEVGPMIAMAEDVGFELSADERERVYASLLYLADPVDFIPDTVPVLGFLDDAIMIDLCVEELRHELEAYSDFAEWREEEAQRRGVDPSKLGVQRMEWADARRIEIMQRMRRRRNESYASGNWNPTLFRVR
ncbi:MAG TPA: YkvA family protein [Rhodanobacteraceae bacterium]|nr:YkvA family protein [Rhodanobacteraceae bacterium]